MVEKEHNLVLDKVCKCASIHIVKKGQMYTAQELIAEMRKMQGERLAQEFAEELGISHSYLSRIYRGKTDPGELVLNKLGLQKRVFYEKVDKVA